MRLPRREPDGTVPSESQVYREGFRMSLDIAVLNDDEAVDRYVPIGVEAHHRLMALCEAGDLRLLARLSDYYSEGEIFQQELAELGEELRSARSRAVGDADLVRVIGELIGLLEFATEKKRSLIVIPD